MVLNIEGLSKNEIKAVADLEFSKKYFFRKADISQHFKNRKQLSNTLFTLKKKGRILKLGRDKYYLVPIKARKGMWFESPIIITDEMMDGKDYFIGGWYAAHYWHLTDQVPMQVDIFTTRRQGKTKVMNMRFVFHRTTKKRIERESIKGTTEGHEFRIMSKEESRRWMRPRRSVLRS